MVGGTYFILAAGMAGLWAAAMASAGPLSSPNPPIESVESLHEFPAGGAAPAAVTPPLSALPIYKPSGPAREPVYRQRLRAQLADQSRQEHGEPAYSGLRWSIAGARPSLVYRLAPNQVVRLGGSLRGARLTLLWDF